MDEKARSIIETMLWSGADRWSAERYVDSRCDLLPGEKAALMRYVWSLVRERRMQVPLVCGG